MKIALRLRTTNDRNGNPRRVWLLIRPAGQHGPGKSHRAEVIDIRDEGYGDPPFDADDVVELPTIDVGPAEYRYWTREHFGPRTTRREER